MNSPLKAGATKSIFITLLSVKMAYNCLFELKLYLETIKSGSAIKINTCVSVERVDDKTTFLDKFKNFFLKSSLQCMNLYVIPIMPCFFLFP